MRTADSTSRITKVGSHSPPVRSKKVQTWYSNMPMMVVVMIFMVTMLLLHVDYNCCSTLLLAPRQRKIFNDCFAAQQHHAMYHFRHYTKDDHYTFFPSVLILLATLKEQRWVEVGSNWFGEEETTNSDWSRALITDQISCLLLSFIPHYAKSMKLKSHKINHAIIVFSIAVCRAMCNAVTRLCAILLLFKHVPAASW